MNYGKFFLTSCWLWRALWHMSFRVSINFCRLVARPNEWVNDISLAVLLTLLVFKFMVADAIKPINYIIMNEMFVNCASREDKILGIWYFVLDLIYIRVHNDKKNQDKIPDSLCQLFIWIFIANHSFPIPFRDCRGFDTDFIKGQLNYLFNVSVNIFYMLF